MPTLYIIAGPNGAGKTTAAKTLLPQVFKTDIFLNADEIAARINPDNVEAAAFQAGRTMLLEINKMLEQKTSFSIETTLATRSYLHLVKKAQLMGYEVVLLFLFLPSAEMAKERVLQRVSKGGHNIPDDVIERRFTAGIRNLFEFIKIVDRWRIFENATIPPNKIAEGERDLATKIFNLEVWEKLKAI